MPQVTQVIENGRLVWRLLNDQRVPRWVRFGIPLLVLLYFISPLDVIPDFIPVVGELDDLGVVLLGMNLIIRFAPQDVSDEHRRALGYDVAPRTSSATTSGWTTPPAAGPGGNNGPINGEFTVVQGETDRAGRES